MRIAALCTAEEHKNYSASSYFFTTLYEQLKHIVFDVRHA